ncbi:MAG: hypothetical protein WBA77_09670 [Microcoleaceae cyanobacterium]
MGLYRALVCSSLLLICFASSAQSTSLESTLSDEVRSTSIGQTDSEGGRSPLHRGSGR